MFPNNDNIPKKRNLQSTVFGHRLRPDQTIYEYMIEFLQVMISRKAIVSADDIIVDEFNDYFPKSQNFDNNDIKFYPISRVGLKRFIFLKKSKQDGKYNVDIGAYNRCVDIVSDKLDLEDCEHDFIDENYCIDILENLLYGFRSVVKNRSWYAQSTLPICKEVILPETMGNKSKRKKIREYCDGDKRIDGEFETNKYNFMSRGGEVYYLHVLSAINNNEGYKDSIEYGFDNLINKFPKLSLITEFIHEVWEGESGCKSKENITKTLGNIPDGFNRREEYTLIELRNFLSTNLHPFEKIDILSYGILLQILRMMHEQACYTSEKNIPFWLVDIRENNKSNSEIRKLAIKSYSNFEQDVLEALYTNLKYNIKDDEVESEVMSKAAKETYKLYRKLGKEIGIVIPATGPGMRFTLSENMIKFLVLSIIKPKCKLTLDTFLDKVYEHYRIVIDSRHYEQEIKNNEEAYLEDLSMLYNNKVAFQELLKGCGFLRDLSDSTSIVENPYDIGR